MRDKKEWREMLLAGRRAVPARDRERDAALLASTLAAACSRLPDGPVCGYVPMGTEPGATAMLDALRASGRDVLLPVIPAVTVRGHDSGTGAARQLHWARYLGAEHLATGPLGVRRPVGSVEGPAAITGAVLVLVPALAVDRRGVRLGRGGGWYDRTLQLVPTGTPVLAVIRDDELVERLPRGPHDVPVTGVITPVGGVRRLR